MKKLLRAFVLSFAMVGLISALVTPPANAEEPIDPVVATAAGQYYLSVVCRSNAAKDRFSRSLEKAEKRGWSEGDKPTKAMRKAARKASRATARAARKLVRYNWPEQVSFEAQTIAEDLYAESSVLGSIADGGTSLTFWGSPSAVPRLRLALGLGPADTDDDGCS